MTNPRRTVLFLAVALVCALPASAIAAGRPAATTQGASALSPTSATIAGSVNPNGLVTTWYFQFGKTKSYGSRTTAQDAGSGTKTLSVSSQLTGLSGNTTYHYRLVATNSAGATFGSDRSFKTPQAPTVSTIATTPNPVTLGGVVTVGGFLVGPKGGGGKQVALEINEFPFTAGFHQFGNTVVTAPDGGYQFFVTPLLNTQMRVVDRSSPSIVSPVATQNVAFRVSLHATRRSRRKVVRFHGYVTPARNASVIVIQRRTRHGGWKNIGVTLPRNRAGARASSYSRRLRVGVGVFRAVARPNGGAYVEGISSPVRVKAH